MANYPIREAHFKDCSRQNLKAQLTHRKSTMLTIWAFKHKDHIKHILGRPLIKVDRDKFYHTDLRGTPSTELPTTNQGHSVTPDFTLPLSCPLPFPPLTTSAPEPNEQMNLWTIIEERKIPRKYIWVAPTPQPWARVPNSSLVTFIGYHWWVLSAKHYSWNKNSSSTEYRAAWRGTNFSSSWQIAGSIETR